MKKTILTIVLAMLCLILSLQSQDQDTITGTIYTQDRKPLAGVTIKIMDTDISTTTDENGKFSLVSKTKKGTLTFSYTGYETQSMDYIMGREDKFNIFMQEQQAQLKEIEINAGYYIVKERERTGSISRVTAETIEKQPINNPLQALQGRVPGVEIVQQTGVPGGGFSVQVRGRNSINPQVGNNPLYIVDGVPYPSGGISSNNSAAVLSQSGVSPLSFLNPYDIQSIEVLKDADATAIYGSRGANGVILITTKKQKGSDLKINASISQAMSRLGNKLDLLNTEQYLEMRREAFTSDGLSPSATDFDVNGTWDEQSYTDWQDLLIGGTAAATNASLNISGGNVNSNYLLGGNYYKEGTVFPGDFGLTRTSMHTSLNFGSPTSPFSAAFSASFSNSQSDLTADNLTSRVLLPPNAPDPYDEYGKLNWADKTVYVNPMALLLKTNHATTDNLVTNLTLNYKILKGLMIKASVGYTTIKREEFSKTPLASRSPALSYTAAQRVSNFTNNFNNSLIAEPQLTYHSKLGPGKLEALLGMSFQHNQAQNRTIRATGFNSDELMDNIASASTFSTPTVSYLQYRYAAIFARLNYGFKDRYFLNVTARRDGSSRFGEGRQFANFGALGAAWIFSEEKFIKENLSFISYGKLRASYGITGNDQIQDYGYLQLWKSLGTYQGISTLTPIRIANADFAWETNRKAEMALQIGLLGDRINFEASFYRNRSSNQLVGLPLPLSTGNASIQANLPATVQNTGWEFVTNFRVLEKETWQWSFGLNLTIPRNKLLSYPGGIENSDYRLSYVIGEPLSIRKTYQISGIDPETGLYKIEDQNGNGVLDNEDLTQVNFLGQYFYGGLHNSITFKKLSLDFLISFTKQNGNSYHSALISPGYFDFIGPTVNQPIEVLQRWQKPGDQAAIQKFSTTGAAYTRYMQASGDVGPLSVVDASFVRLKNISLNYGLPKAWLSKLKLSEGSVSLQGQNVFTITNYQGLDSESQSMLLPPLRTLALAFNLTF